MKKLTSLEMVTRLPPLPDRPEDGHKGTFGRVLVLGGSAGMIGAPGFAGLAALRMGCGLAYVAAQRAVLGTILSAAPELVGIALGPMAALRAGLMRADAVIVGPGLGQLAFAAGTVSVSVECACPLVVDADALNLIAARKVTLDRPAGTAVLTPHPGEMERLGKLFGQAGVPDDEDGRIAIAVLAAKYFNQVIVLKGHRSVITDGLRTAINQTGDSSLAKAGSGDVLSGMIGTLLAQRMNAFDAAQLGVYLHGLAGEIAGKGMGRRSVLARDLIAAIPAAIGRIST